MLRLVASAAAMAPASSFTRHYASGCFGLMLVATLCNCVVLDVEWSPQGVQAYSDSSLTVHLGDAVNLICPNGSFSNVFITSNRDYYDSCACDGTSIECDDGFVFSCGLREAFRVDIVQGTYFEGETYYFISFSKGRNIADATAKVAMGGECVSRNLKLQLHVLQPDDSTTPVTVPTTPTDTNDNPEIDWSPEGVLPYADKPLSLRLGETLVFVCPNGSFSNIFFMTHTYQYGNCSCRSAADPCKPKKTCGLHASPRFSENLVEPLYKAGHTYYFASFSDGESLADSISRRDYGGECVSKALKFKVYIEPFTFPAATSSIASIISSLSPAPIPSVTGTDPSTRPSSTLDIKVVEITGIIAGCIVLLIFLLVVAILVIYISKRKHKRQLYNELDVANVAHVQGGFRNAYYQQDSKDPTIDAIYAAVGPSEYDDTRTTDERIYDFVGRRTSSRKDATPDETLYDSVAKEAIAMAADKNSTGIESEGDSEDPAVYKRPIRHHHDPRIANTLAANAYQIPSQLARPEKQSIANVYQHPKTPVPPETESLTVVQATTAAKEETVYQEPCIKSKSTEGDALERSTPHHLASKEQPETSHLASTEQPETSHLASMEQPETSHLESREQLETRLEFEKSALQMAENSGQKTSSDDLFVFTKPGVYEVPYIPKKDKRHKKSSRLESATAANATAGVSLQFQHRVQRGGEESSLSCAEDDSKKTAVHSSVTSMATERPRWQQTDQEESLRSHPKDSSRATAADSIVVSLDAGGTRPGQCMDEPAKGFTEDGSREASLDMTVSVLFSAVAMAEAPSACGEETESGVIQPIDNAENGATSDDKRSVDTAQALHNDTVCDDHNSSSAPVQRWTSGVALASGDSPQVPALPSPGNKDEQEEKAATSQRTRDCEMVDEKRTETEMKELEPPSRYFNPTLVEPVETCDQEVLAGETCTEEEASPETVH